MKLGMLVPKDMKALPFEQVAGWASENGFRAIDADPGSIECCRQHGLEVACIRSAINVLTIDDREREKAQEELIKVVDEAVAKGVHRAMASHWRQPGMTTEQSIEIFRKGYGPVVARAERYDFKFVMEIWPGGGRTLAASPELWRAIFDAVPSPSLGLCLDPSHLVWQGIDYVRATKEFGKRIFYAHAKDTEILPDKRYEYGVMGRSLGTGALCSGWWRYRLPGYGEINWPCFISTLIEAGYDDVLAIEHEDQLWYGSPELNQKGLLLAKRALEPYLI